MATSNFYSVAAMEKVIVKSSLAVIGKVQGTGAGTKFSAKMAKKISKPFVLKNEGFLKQFISFNVKVGDEVCFLYC